MHRNGAEQRNGEFDMPMIGDVLHLPEIEINPYKKQEYGPNNGGSYGDFAGSTEGRPI